MRPLPRWWIRLRHWEYWPMQVVYLPVLCYYLWLSLKARSLAFFTVANPAIPNSGFVDDPKSAFHHLFPAHLQPVTLELGRFPGREAALDAIGNAGLTFPVMAKPDVGERGFLVHKLDTPSDLRRLAAYPQVQWLIQEYVRYPLEISVLYYRIPGKPSGTISSLTLKIHLSVTGDGRRTIAGLVRAYPRAWLQWEAIRKEHPEWETHIPADGEKWVLVPVGNHARGAMFLNGAAHITPALTQVFDELAGRLDGVYFGRFDLMCASIEALEQGRDFKIIEWNGAKSEPVHIYDPNYPIWKAWRDLFRHWRALYEVSVANIRAGHRPMRFLALLALMRQHVRGKRAQSS